MSYYVGSDWASTAHQFCAIDGDGQIVWHDSVPHTTDGFATLRRRLERFGTAADVSVAIERPSGLRTVLGLAALRTNREIAAELSMSEKTVHHHIAALLQKLRFERGPLERPVQKQRWV